MKIAFQHTSYKPIRFVVPGRTLRGSRFIFGQHLVHEVCEEFLVGRGQTEGLFFFRILKNGQVFPGAMFFGEQEIFRKCQQSATDGGMFFFEMNLVGKSEEQMTRLYFMADKVYPV